ncbi:MAG: hypothetical protein LBI47_00040 [Puniceicoccales bacterium]|jgi:hypothetical protein|nr:hypothetical protein [Puniceicoccales bacterium]
MDINTRIKVTLSAISAIPDNSRVAMLREEGLEVHVFQRIETRWQDMEARRMVARRMVAIKFPYAQDGEYIYDTYDSALEDEGLFPLKTLTEREVKALQDDPAFTHE